jgi:putative membrane protein
VQTNNRASKEQKGVERMETMPLMHESWGVWPFLAPLWIILWIVVIATAIRFIAHRWDGRGCGPRRGDGLSASEILAQRLARGEIDETEYRSRLDLLRQ